MTSPKSGRAIAGASGLALLTLAGALAVAADGPDPHYPDGYRAWRVARFKLIGPDHPNYEKQGGFRHHFANDAAFASWGHFTDGAVKTGLTREPAKQTCFDACHRNVATRDSVFSDPRR